MEWKKVQNLIEAGKVEVNGESLEIGTVVAVAKYGCKPFIDTDPALVARMADSKKTLEKHLLWGRSIYGVNTGFGANADTRTTDFVTLQRALTQHQQSAILTKNDLSVHGDKDGEHNSHSMPTSWVRGAMLVRVNTTIRGHSAISFRVVDMLAELVRRDMIPIVPLRGSISASGDLMPLAYIAGALQGNPDIYVRTRGGGGRKILKASDAMAQIQQMRMEESKSQNSNRSKEQGGKVSEVGPDPNENKDGKKKGKKNKNRKGKKAGDGSKDPEENKPGKDSKSTEEDKPGKENKSSEEAKPEKESKSTEDAKPGKESKTTEENQAGDDSTKVQGTQTGKDSNHTKDSVGDGHKHKYTPLVLGPKEGLALVNGTAPSATVATLAVYEANQLAVLAQVITCLSSEALAANIEWAHPFIAEIRPHQGQMEVARNLRYFFRGSALVTGLSKSTHDARARTGLVQDRYALRTSSQWIGPVLDDLWVSTGQLTVELNSTTDNPVVNPEVGEVYCGGNFQASVVTQTTEKMRLCLQTIGKMLFAQTSELINPVTSKGLPPNLAADDPSLSFCMKGVDINMAGYQSELAMLANPISSHVQSAEMHNQAINSLALISARYTMDSVQVLTMMTAAAIYVGLQAVDLRVMHQEFMDSYPNAIKRSVVKYWEGKVSPENVQVMLKLVAPQLSVAWFANASCDLDDRCHKVARSVTETVLECYFERVTKDDPKGQTDFHYGLHALRNLILTTLAPAFREWRSLFWNQTANVTVPRLGLGTRALYQFVRGELGVPFHRGLQDDPIAEPSASDENRPKKTVGSWISIIYEAVRDGRICGHILASLKEDLQTDPGVVANLAAVNEAFAKALQDGPVAGNDNLAAALRSFQEHLVQPAPQPSGGRAHRRRA
ncbi:hypothetical protein A1O3_09801 [Capronia epimyces CBS 606.96]|uniref:Phenylalanine ammonia-lyase n=1 Tax=Capronia epimyces CBS 606.96 TaxID=1182542 RepID=W9Y541_9EURO|nr:uncharacterized protein A1O3_09801 [Capronia epimyces CBS 606.96]EXJ77574.1 hypothetical protein A1O3_09801 [Capronia epimyces CBS 606.96]